MPIYTAAITSVIVVSAVIIFLVFNKLKILSFKTLLSITLASLICAISLPGIFNIISSRLNGLAEKLLLITVATAAIYIVLAFILSMIISRVIPGLGAVPKTTKSLISEAGLSETEATDENYLEQIYASIIHENENQMPNPVENTVEEVNNLEISVDSSEKIDKMGIENIVPNSEILTIGECIEEAFRFKEQSDAEGAILYYMYALDKKPQKELTFWIVLDICVMYKDLGQYELAFDILNNYHDVYGDIMDVSIKEEIENNLSIIQA